MFYSTFLLVISGYQFWCKFFLTPMLVDKNQDDATVIHKANLLLQPSFS